MTEQKERPANIELVWEERQTLSDVSTFRIGGPARYYVVVRTIAQMQAVLTRCHSEQLRFFVLGKGSNSLFDDRGFDGVVIHNKIEFCEWTDDQTVRVGAGYSFALLGVKTARKQLSGLEFASGIPASVGGAVFMNAGANGHETCDVLHSVEYCDATGNMTVLSREDLQFGYRHSPFQGKHGAIVAATFRLTASSAARSDQLKIIDYRTNTQPYGEPSAGCVFRNPDGGHAGVLIEESGLKGQRVGDAQVSTKHANFIVNLGAATAHDVEQLINMVRDRVYEASGVELEDEVRRVAFRGEAPTN